MFHTVEKENLEENPLVDALRSCDGSNASRLITNYVVLSRLKISLQYKNPFVRCFDRPRVSMEWIALTFLEVLGIPRHDKVRYQEHNGPSILPMSW